MFQEETSFKFKLFLFFFGFAWPVSAGLLEPSLDLAVPFFKTPESPFPSGQANRNKLLDSLISSSTDLQFRVQWSGQEHLVEHTALLREIELSTLVVVKNTTNLRLLAETNASSLTQMRPGQKLEVLSHRGPWMRVKLKAPLNSKNPVGYVLTSEVEPHFTDIQRYTSLTDLILKKQPYQNSKSVVVINRLSQLDLVEINNGWGLFKTQSRQGWAPLSEVIGRSDFATKAWDLVQKKWVNIHSRHGAHMTLLEKLEKRSLSEFSGFQSQKFIAILQGTHPKIPKGARVEIKEVLARRWNLSRLQGHGEVWWPTLLESSQKSSSLIRTSDLLQKNLSAMSFDSKTKKGLAAAGGIYRTKDGKKWQKIDFFGSENWPVCLHPSGAWFVGPFVSTDEGETFKPAIKWSDVVKRLQLNEPKRKIPFFRVIDIKSVDNETVEIKVDTGIKTARLRSHALSHDWAPLP
jgi:hypothetical protein